MSENSELNENENSTCSSERLNPQIINFIFNEGSGVRTIMKGGDPYFNVRDVCDILEIKNHNHALTRVYPEDIVKFFARDSVGRMREANFVSEPGLYELIFASEKAEAKVFRRWVTTEVLPAIRKTGSYSILNKYANRDSHLKWFEERCEISEELSTGCVDLEHDYIGWCLSKGIKAMSFTNFSIRMKELGFGIKLGFNAEVNGVGLKYELNGTEYLKKVKGIK